MEERAWALSLCEARGGGGTEVRVWWGGGCGLAEAGAKRRSVATSWSIAHNWSQPACPSAQACRRSGGRPRLGGVEVLRLRRVGARDWEGVWLREEGRTHGSRLPCPLYSRK